jgi:1-acyl-sn-glycerol-3-phosphate acyltransferase
MSAPTGDPRGDLGASSAHVCFDPRVAASFYRGVSWLSRRLRVDVRGLENVPADRALLVSNHSFGVDSILPMAAVWEGLGRPVWVLAEHAWWRIPLLRRLASAVGAVDGTPENADRLLANGELVLVLPGGLREAVKPRELRYRLLWGHRYGFIRAAIRNQTPIVPLASIGGDDMFDLVGDAYRRGERWLRHGGVPVPLPARILPIPHLVHLSFIFGEPVLPRASPEQADDPAVLRRLRHEVEGALHELIDNELARRAGLDLA